MAAKVFASFFLFLLCLSAVCNLGLAQNKYWCVAKPSTDEATLKNHIDYACRQTGVDCSFMHNQGHPCFYPNSRINQASVAMNLYYQVHKTKGGDCNFDGTGLLSITNPSYGNCKYA